MLPFCKQKFSNLYSSQKPLLVYSHKPLYQPLLLIPLIHYLRNPSVHERQHSSMFSPESDVVHISASYFSTYVMGSTFVNTFMSKMRYDSNLIVSHEK